MIDSDLGLIPRGWNIQTIGEFVIDIKNGSTPRRSISEYWNDGTIPWIVTGEVNNSIILDTSEKITELGLVNSSTKLLPINSVIIALYGKGTAARLGLLKIKATTNQACCAMICSTPNKSAFLYETLYCMHDYIDSLASGSVQQNLSKDLIKNLKMIVPPDEYIESLNLMAIFNTMENNYKENNILKSIRDLILPKLMSGMIDISKLDLSS